MEEMLWDIHEAATPAESANTSLAKSFPMNRAGENAEAGHALFCGVNLGQKRV